MKNQKPNNRGLISKIIARVMLVLLLLTSAMSFVSCDLYDFFGYSTSDMYYYDTHSEFVTFIEKFNSENDGFASTFISFDFDSNDMISDTYYSLGGIIYHKRNTDTIYDKYQDNITVGMCFYIKEINNDGKLLNNAYQIICAYNPNNLNYNFDENDSISLRLLDNVENKPSGWENNSTDIQINPNEIIYNYVASCLIDVNGTDLITIYIGSLEENISQEKLDEICKLLMDNIVIINTEG